MDNSANPIQPDPDFLKSIQAGLRYWQSKTKKLSPEQMQWLDGRHKNLHQAIEFGLTQPGLWQDTVELLLQTFDFSESGGYWPEWIPVLEKALANAPKRKTLLHGRIQNRLGQLYRLDRRIQEAEEQHNEALALADKIASDELLLISYTCLAELKLTQKNVEQTRKFGKLGLALANALPGYERMEGFNNFILGQIEDYVGNHPAAVQHLKEAGVVWQKLENHLYWARSLQSLGAVYIKINKYEQAEKSFATAGQILKTTTYIKDHASILINLAVLFFRQEKWSQAEEALLQVGTIKLREQKEFDLLAMFYNNLGNVYFKMKRWDEAAEHLNFAVELFRQTENGIDLGNSLGTLGLVYKNKGINKKALPAFEEAIPLLEMFPESQFAKKLLEDFVPAYEQLLADG